MKVKMLIVMSALLFVTACDETKYDEKSGVIAKRNEVSVAGTAVTQFYLIMKDGRKIEVTEQMYRKCPVKSEWPECWK